jgi:hypothetical protein
MNEIQINAIEKIVNEHRREMFVTCIETCPCWDFQRIIDNWENKRG